MTQRDRRHITSEEEFTDDGSGHAGERHTDAPELLDDERSVLRAIRSLCSAFSQSWPLGWTAALDICDAEFGPHDGPVIAGRLMALLRSARKERAEPFDYMSPTCPHCQTKLSEGERMLMSLVKAARCLDPQAMIQCAVSLTRSREPRLTIMAAISLGASLARHSEHQGAAGPCPTAIKVNSRHTLH